MAPRVAAGGLLNSPNDPRRLPNYARYPGDTLGMSSNLSLNSLTGLGSLTISFDFYKNIKEDMVNGSPADVLPWDGGAAPDVRNYEIAALAPDLFDITYYSIEPNFTVNYYPRLVANRGRLGIPNDTVLRPDLGHHNPPLANFSVQDQMGIAAGRQRAEAFYFVRSKVHLLTAWLPGSGAFNYELNASLQNFGKCTLPDDNLRFKTPGSCAAGGGRTGYSVKLISRDALRSTQHKIGGDAAANSIINPPPTAQGW